MIYHRCVFIVLVKLVQISLMDIVKDTLKECLLDVLALLCGAGDNGVWKMRELAYNISQEMGKVRHAII